MLSGDFSAEEKDYRDAVALFSLAGCRIDLAAPTPPRSWESLARDAFDLGEVAVLERRRRNAEDRRKR